MVLGPSRCGLGNADVYVVHETGEPVSGPSEARTAIHRAYEVDKNDTDHPFTIRTIGPNRSEFNTSYAYQAPLEKVYKNGIPARSADIGEDETIHLFLGGSRGVGATEEGEVFVLTEGIC